MTPRRRHALQMFVGLGLLVFVVSITYVIITGAERTDKISETQDQSVAKSEERDQVVLEIRALAAQIRSCTDPEKPCAKRGQQATANAIAEIQSNQAVSAAAATACAVEVKPVTFDNVYACVLKRQAEQDQLSREAPVPSQ